MDRCPAVGAGTVAQAQEKPADETAAQQSGGSLEEITVTGSRIKRTNDFNTPTPTTVIDSVAMENMGMVNIGETLQLTPTDFLQGLQFSADYFHIKINNAIEQANMTLVENECRNGIAVACSQINFEPGTGGAAVYQAGSYNISAITPTS